MNTDAYVRELETTVARLESSLKEVRERKDHRIVELVQQLSRAREEIVVDEELIAHRTLLLEAIPECPQHGPCVPHALEWIQKAKECMNDREK